MNPKLETLLTKYPKIFQGLRYGFECSDGWYDLIDTLCNCIQSYVDHATPPLEIPTDILQVVAIQVKEKFGGLRFYHHGGDTHTDGMITFAEYMSYHICD